MKKRKLIFLGIIFFIIAILFSNFQFFTIDSFVDGIDYAWALKMVSISFLLLSISELFFIKANVVPKLLRMLIYFQWIIVPIVIIITLFTL